DETASSRKSANDLQPEEVAEIDNRKQRFAAETTKLDEDLDTIIKEGSVQQVAQLVERAQALREELESFVGVVDRRLGLQKSDDPEADLARIIDNATELFSRAKTTIGSTEFGLKPIDIDTDDAMLTALVLRFDLMNQREALADNWRQIKLAADDLKAILDINATQIINTDSNSNDPFNFTFDDSSTSLGMTFDAPLNRFIERNNFRATLIDYQRELRTMTQLEDNIKFAIRNDLRNLTLDREQYLIAVASAALAYERVVSTSLEFRLGTGGVTARDFLEAQTAYTDALSNVASRHIDYITDRAQLFLDLELLYVDEDGFWDDIRNEQLQPEPVYNLPPWSYPVYGKLPCVCYSDEILQGMSCLCESAAAKPFPEFMPEVEIPAELADAYEATEMLQSVDDTALPRVESHNPTLPAQVPEPIDPGIIANPISELLLDDQEAEVAEPYFDNGDAAINAADQLELPFPDAP
ncbi:MAG: TolC family protein, partial [Planctomycetota bacterium]